MIEQSVSLASNGVVKVPGYEHLVRFGYTKNRGVYRLTVTATGEWEGLTIRAFWHLPGGTAPESSLVADGYVDVPASVTAQPGDGCITFEGTDGTKTVTSADLHYRVNANSGTEDGTMPEPGTPAWEQLVGVVRDNADKAEQAKTDAQTAAEWAGASAKKAGQALFATIAAKGDALKAISDKQTTATQAVGTARDDALKQVQASTKAAQTAAREAATSASNADQSAQEAADSLQELKDGIANGDFKGEDGLDAPQIDDTTVTDSSPWSSKHIVDMLCPPLEETGNPVQCYPVAGYPLGCKVNWEPTQEGTGDPSPDNVRPIKGRDSVTVERCGENLLDVVTGYVTAKVKIVRCNYTVESNEIVINATGADAYVGEVCTGKGIKYSANLGPLFIVHENANLYLFLSNTSVDKNYITFFNKDLVSIGAYKPIMTNSAYFTVPEGAVYAAVRIGIANSAKGETYRTTISVTCGTTAPASYTPYTGQTTTLTLPTTIYGGTVDTVTGEGQKTWGLIDSYAGEDLPGKWISDRDVYADGTVPATGAQIAYKLADPVPITATGAQPIPALSGINTVLTDADSITVTGRADPIKRITDLEDAVASMT